MRRAALFVAALQLGLIRAECPNACSGNGECSAYYMCTCRRNFQGSDCSQRTCPFGIAHVDSPKGDLDMSADSLTTGTVISGSAVYPFGTQEKFPEMVDGIGGLTENAAHYYMECSNKGMCDRDSGLCGCFPGYDGASCQRASCPEDCSGHGTCEHIETLAGNDYENVYAIWDSGMTMGCSCDAGYTGPNCAVKECKYGIDPLYIDDDSTARMTETVIDIRGTNGVQGTYAIKFYDVFGEDYQTAPIQISTATAATGTCAQLTTALEALPNTVIPGSSIYCSSQQYTTLRTTYALTFTGNPGYLKPLFVDTYLDGHRETIYPILGNQEVTNDGYTTQIDVYQKGVSGEFTDYFASKCVGVEVSLEGKKQTVASAATYGDGTAANAGYGLYSYEMNSGYYLGSLSDDESALLKKCLGDSDGNDSYGNNVEVYDWDYGSYKITGVANLATNYNWIDTPSSHPHAIKLISTSAADDYVGGLYYLTWYQATMNRFVLINAPISTVWPSTSTNTTSYYVYATDGVVERVIVDTVSKGQITQGQQISAQPPVTAYFTQYSNVMYTSYDVACETAPSMVEPCLDKGDMLFVVDSLYLTDSQNVSAASVTTLPAYTADSGNLYTIKKIYKQDPTKNTFSNTGYEDRFRIVLDQNIPFAGTATSTSTTSGTFGAQTGSNNVGIVNLFKFTPATTGNYEFVSQCSNRGSCIEGTCECYRGYNKDDCSQVNVHAL